VQAQSSARLPENGVGGIIEALSKPASFSAVFI
jgi:hypothetical protein